MLSSLGKEEEVKLETFWPMPKLTRQHLGTPIHWTFVRQGSGKDSTVYIRAWCGVGGSTGTEAVAQDENDEVVGGDELCVILLTLFTVIGISLTIFQFTNN